MHLHARAAHTPAKARSSYYFWFHHPGEARFVSCQFDPAKRLGGAAFGRTA